MTVISNLLRDRQSAIKKDLIEYIKRAIPQDGSKLNLNLDRFELTVAYKVDCDCFDDLCFLYLDGKDVLASLRQEPENEVDLEYFHESSLIDIIDYCERHGLIDD